MRNIITKKDMWNYGRNYKVYPIWRRPLVIPSFYVARFLVNHGFKHPTILSISMIIIGFCGAILMFFNSLYLHIIGSLLILFSYFLDLMDGKTARMLKKESFVGKFIDRNYHTPITAVALFGLGFSLYLNDSNILFGVDFSRYGLNLGVIYLITGFFCSLMVILKSYMHSSYIHFLRDIRISKGKNIDYFYSPDANKQVTEDIEKFTKNKNFRKIYNNFFCLFVVTTDLWFLLFIVVLFELEKYLLILLILIYVPLYFINFVRDYKSLCKQEIGN